MSKRSEMSTALSQMLATWREDHWPPKGMKQIKPNLEIYEGTHEQLTAFSHALSEVMLKLEQHILEVCDGRVPRWMAIPKVVFHVERLNLVWAPAKASKRIDDMVQLCATCGKFSADDRNRLEKWFAEHPGRQLVVHRDFNDLRAFVHVPGAPGRRLRFFQSGLAVAPSSGNQLIVQDHRRVIRSGRNDALSNPLAQSESKWRVYVPRHSFKTNK